MSSTSSEIFEKTTLGFLRIEPKRRRSGKAKANKLEKAHYAAWRTSSLLRNAWQLCKRRSSSTKERNVQALLENNTSPSTGPVVASSCHTRTFIRTTGSSHAKPQAKYHDSSNASQQVLNFATAVPSGFHEFEHGTRLVMQHLLASSHSAPTPSNLQNRVQAKVAQEFGFSACYFTSFLAQRNELAMSAVTAHARNMGQPCVFLLGLSYRHSSTIRDDDTVFHAFEPTNLKSLEAKLKTCKAKLPNALVCVALEGLSGEDATMVDLPNIMILKKRYGFYLLLDETRSFLALGSQGKGVIDYHYDNGFHCSGADVDIIVADLHTSIGANGGIVLMNGRLPEALDGSSVKAYSGSFPPTTTLFRLVNILEKPTLVKHRLQQLEKKSAYVRGILRQGGLEVCGSPGSPYISFIVGSPRQAARFVDRALECGILLSASTPRQSSRWVSKIRLTVQATTSWRDIRYLVETLVRVAVDTRVSGARGILPDPSIATLNDSEPSGVALESQRSDYLLWNQIDSAFGLAAVLGRFTKEALLRFALTSSDPAGSITFEPQIRLESQLANLYKPILREDNSSSLALESRTFAGHVDTMTSFLTNLASLITPKDAKRCRHECYAYAGASINLTDNLKHAFAGLANNELHLYVSIPDLVQRLTDRPNDRTRSSQRCRRVITIYIQTSFPSTASRPIPREFLNLNSVLEQVTNSLAQQRYGHVNIVLDDSHAFGALGSRELGLLDYNAHRVNGTSFDSRDFAFQKTARLMPFPALEDRGGKVHLFYSTGLETVQGVQGCFIVGESAIVRQFKQRARNEENMSAVEIGLVQDWLVARAYAGQE